MNVMLDISYISCVKYSMLLITAVVIVVCPLFILNIKTFMTKNV